MKLLLIGDHTKNRRLRALGLAGVEDELACATSGAELAGLGGLGDFHAAVLDWDMTGEPASELLTALRELVPSLPVVVVARGSRAAAEAGRAGAAATVAKPVDVGALRRLLNRWEDKVAAAAASPRPGGASLEFTTRSPSMQKILDIAWRVAPATATVLILGENGTGKTALARAIHDRSSRRDRPFVTVNCPCLQPQLLESDLFGHVRGAFTGAVSDAIGKVAAAEGGTLFLDEIGELPPEIQPKLLRLLQDRCYERVGDSQTREADIRLLAASNRDLKQLVKAEAFREDLYYRLNVISLEVPPLRRRPEDILPAAEHFLATTDQAPGTKRRRGLTLLAQEGLRSHAWPGNLRELRNAVERAAILADRDYLDLTDFPELNAAEPDTIPQVGAFVPLAAIEEAHIREVVARAGSYERAAEILGIDKSTLYRRRRRSDTGIAQFPRLAGSAS